MTVPPPGKGMSIRMDAETHESLRILERAGMTPTQAVRRALQILADAHYNAWDTGAVTVGLAVDVYDASVRPYDVYDVDGRPMSYADATRITEERQRAAYNEKERMTDG